MLLIISLFHGCRHGESVLLDAEKARGGGEILGIRLIAPPLSRRGIHNLQALPQIVNIMGSVDKIFEVTILKLQRNFKKAKKVVGWGYVILEVIKVRQ